MMILRNGKSVDQVKHNKERAIVRKRKSIDDEEEELNMKKRGKAKKTRKIDQDKKKQAVVRKSKKIDDDGEDEEEQNTKKKAYLPEDLVIENILTRLPAQKLARCRCVSKLWYNTIFNDKRFAELHFVQNKDYPYLEFIRLNVMLEENHYSSYFFSLEMEEEDSDHLLYCKSLLDLGMSRTDELVGCCNGLACIRQVSHSGDEGGVVTVINPTRGESLGLYYTTPSRRCSILCHGFGFDSSLGKYKVVVIYTAITAASHSGGQYDEEFLCVVGTLGSNSWSKIVVTITSEMFPLLGCPPFPFKTTSTKESRSATLCGDHLFWRVKNVGTNYKVEVLLSFDIHTEKIEFIRFPTECPLPPVWPNVNEHHHHLLEFKGYLCVACFKKVMVSNSDHCHRCGHRCKDQRSFCCCCFEVHLYILKDKVKQVWVKGETFDVQIKEEDSLTPPICGSSGTSTVPTIPPARIASFSDQLLLYWFDGVSLTFYNLQSKRLKVAKGSQSCNKPNRYGNNNFGMTFDYQLHTQEENIVSLKTFISEGEIRKFDRWDDIKQALGSKKLPAAWVHMGRESVKYYALL